MIDYKTKGREGLSGWTRERILMSMKSDPEMWVDFVISQDDVIKELDSIVLDASMRLQTLTESTDAKPH